MFKTKFKRSMALLATLSLSLALIVGGCAQRRPLPEEVPPTPVPETVPERDTRMPVPGTNLPEGPVPGTPAPGVPAPDRITPTPAPDVVPGDDVIPRDTRIEDPDVRGTR